MWEKIRNAFKELITIDDNETHSLARWIALLSVVTYWAITVYDISKGNPWRMQEFGMGLATVMAAAGLWIWIDEKPPGSTK